MPATLLRDDWQKSVTDELTSHARNLGQAFQVIGDTAAQVAAPTGPDPQQVLAELQQHAQNVSSTVQEAPSGIVQFGQQQAGQVQQELQDFASGLVKFNQAQPPTSAPGSQPLAEGVQPTPAATAPVAAGTLQDYARQQAEKFGLDPDVFTRQIQQESGFNPTAKSPVGATGIAQFMPATAQGMGVDPTDPYASLEGAARLMSNYLKQYQGDYGKALAAYNAGPGNVEKYGGVPPFEETQRYVKTILGTRDTAPYQPNVQESLERVGQGIAPRDISQFGDRQLTNSEAYAACGPAAAVRFAQRFGRNPSLREAVDLSKELGWTEGQGMAGLQSEKALMDRLGVATKVVGGSQWDAFAKEAHSGNPVTISTGAHYFFADSFDPGSGAFHVGRSGTDLVGGKEWMTRGEIESAAQRLGGGQVQGALFADNPSVPSKSAAGSSSGGSGAAPVVARAAQPQPLQIIGDVAERGRQAVTQVVGDLQIASSGESRALTPAMQPTPSDALTNPSMQETPSTPPVTPTNLPPAQETLSQSPLARAFTAPDTSLTAAMQPTPSDQLTSPTLRTGEAAQPPPSMPPPLAGPAILPSLGEARDAIAAGDNQAALDALSRAGEAASTTGAAQALGEQRLLGVREEIANAPVLGGALGMLRGPELLSDEELLQQASPEQITSARSLIERGNQIVANKRGEPPEPVTDADIASFLRSTRVAEAVASAPAAPASAAAKAAGASKGIDYEALARLRREARATQPGLPDMPAAGESRVNQEIAASVNNMFAVPSMVTNAVGGGIETIKRPLVTALTGNLGAAGADLRAMGLGLGDAFADGASTFRTGIRPSRAASAEVMGQAAKEGQDILDPRSGAWRIGFLRSMEATDEFMRSLNSAGAQASEFARLRKAHPDLSQEELLSRFGGNLLEVGEKAAAESVYAVGGSGIGKRMSQWRALLTAPDSSAGERLLGFASHVLVPFSNIPDVILTKGLARLPGVNELTMVRQLRSADPLVRQRAVASAAAAEAVNVAIFAQVMEGNITGNGPADPAKKAALQNARDANGDPIWQPNSVRIGGRWLPYASLGPVGVRMGAIANVTEQISDELSKPNPSDDNLDRIKTTALAALDGTTETVADAWYLQTVGRLFNAMKNGGAGPALGQLALSTAQRAIPYGGELRSIESAVDPTVAEPKNPLEAIAAGIPGLSQFATPKIDPTTGRPLEKPADAGTLLTRSPGTGEPTPVDTALAMHNIGVPDAPQTITQREYTINITPDEQRQYTIEAGQRIEKRVQALLDNPRWSSQTQEQQKDALRQAIGAARADAAALIWRSVPAAEQDRRVKATRARQAQEAEPVFRAPVTTP